MDLERKLTAREIIGTMKNMSDRPEFYSGIGAIRSDLDSKKLDTIYQIIKKEYGEDAAQNFAQMVTDIPILSATDFLLNFYRLEGHNWKWDKKLLGNERGIDIGPDYSNGRREAIAMATIANSLSGFSERDETPYIRGEFLRKLGINDPKDKSFLFY